MSILSTYQASRFVILLSKPFSQWPECKSGIIDETGALVKKDTDTKQLDVFVNLVRKIKIIMEKALGKSRLMQNVISLMLIQECPDLTSDQNEKLNEELGACVSSTIEVAILKEIQTVLLVKGAQILKVELMEAGAGAPSITSFTEYLEEKETTNGCNF